MEKDIATIPYFVFEEMQDAHEKEVERLTDTHNKETTKLEKANKRLMIIIICLILVIAGMVAGALIYESSFDKVSYSQDGEGLNNFNLGSQGDVSAN